MRQFFKFFLASLLALCVAGMLFFIVTIGIISTFSSSLKSSFVSKDKTDVTVKSNSILVIDLSQAINEADGFSLSFLFSGEQPGSTGLANMLNKIKQAKTDKSIKGLYLKADASAIGTASAEQLRNALKDFKMSGKFIYAYGDAISQSAYYLASVSDSVFINPMGMVEIKGLASKITFYKGALDKLEVEPEIFYCGKFKSATEPFRRKEMSAENRTQLAALQSNIWDTYLKAFAEHTKQSPEIINQWAQERTIEDAQDALTHKLVDGIWYKDEMEALLQKRTGTKKVEDLNLLSINSYPLDKVKVSTKDEIALLIAEGEIVDKESNNNPFLGTTGPEIAPEPMIKAIRSIKEDDNIKAVVFRVNSPGGSALASEKILRELDLLRKKKPVVVSMGDLAASGGYYISCHADSIFALPSTITGSIGVFGIMANTQQFFNKKLGITFDEEKNAPYADLGNMNRPMTAQEKVFIQNGVDSIYNMFKNRVATGRKVSMAYVDSIGQGRVWSGTAGLANGLVDALGDLPRAFKSAASLAKIKDYKVTVYPKPKNDMKDFLALLGSNVEMKNNLMSELMLKEQLGSGYSWLKMFRQLDRRNNQILMMMPFIPEIK